MIKRFLYPLLILFTACLISCTSTRNLSHPIIYNLDIYDYSDDFSLKANKEKTMYFHDINKIKIKNPVLLSGDTISVYLAFSANCYVDSLTCELIDGEGNVIGTEVMDNEAAKKKFLSSASFELSDDLINPLSIHLYTEDEEITRKVKIQLIDLEIKKIGDEYSKKYSKKQLPGYIKDITEETEESTSNWYISKVSEKQRAGAMIFGPFETKEQAIAIWILKNYKSGGWTCISKNYTYVTNSPDSYFPEYDDVYDTFNTYGTEGALDYYFLGSE